MRTPGSLMLLVTLMLVHTACGASSDALIARGASDLDCPKAEIVVRSIDARTRRVTGCGGKAIYIESCQGEGFGRSCTWVLNSEVGGRE